MSDAYLGEALLAQRLQDGIVACTFGLPAAVERARRFVRPAHSHSGLAYDVFLNSSFALPLSLGLSPNIIVFFAYNELGAHESDKHWTVSTQPGVYIPWCVLDFTTNHPSHIIPSRLFVPYLGTLRCETTLGCTDMLPIFFKRADGDIGVFVDENADFNVVLDNPTRISATSLKVVLNLWNYLGYEGQIQLRSSGIGNISSRRLARLVATKVRRCRGKCAQEQNKTMAHWVAPRWKFGSGPGYITAADVQLLGVVFVSPGKITPLLQVRSDFLFGS